MNVERFELQIIQCAKHVLENQSRIIFTELATNKESKLFKDAVSKFRYWTDRVNYAAKPTYLFQGGISIKKKIKLSAKRLYWNEGRITINRLSVME